MSGLMACLMLRSALARISSSRGTRLASPCSINRRIAASRTGFIFAGHLGECLLYWKKPEETATGPSAAIVQVGPENRNNPTTPKCDNGSTKRNHHDGELRLHKTQE